MENEQAFEDLTIGARFMDTATRQDWMKENDHQAKNAIGALVEFESGEQVTLTQ